MVTNIFISIGLVVTFIYGFDLMVQMIEKTEQRTVKNLLTFIGFLMGFVCLIIVFTFHGDILDLL